MTQSLRDPDASGDAPQRTGNSLFDDPQNGTPSDQAPRRKYRLRTKLLAMLGFTLGALVVGSVIVELGLRAFGVPRPPRIINLSSVGSPYRVSENHVLGFEHKRNYRNENPEPGVSFASTNSHGQRDIERTLEKPPGVRRILLLGDSIVESLEVVELDDLMNRQLEKLYPDGKTEVLNFGVNGYCTRAEVELLKTKGIKFDPDLVVLVFVGNDYLNFNASAGGTVAGIEQMQQEFDVQSKSAAYKVCYLNSNLFRAIAHLVHWLDAGDRSTTSVVNSNRLAIGDNNVNDGLKLLRELADNHGFEVVVAIWPVFEDDGFTNKAQRNLKGSDKMIVEVLAAMYGFPSVRLSSRFEEHFDSQQIFDSPSQYTVGDKTHVNEAGSRAAAAVLKTVVDDYPKLKAELPESSEQMAAAAVEAARLLGSISHVYDMAFAVAELGKTKEQEGRLDEALAYYELALEFDPNSKRAHKHLGNYYAAAGDLAKAHYHLEKAQP